MTSRMDLLDKIGQFLTTEFGKIKVTQRQDGIIILAGKTEAFAVQVLTIDPPDGIDPRDFGEDLVRHIENDKPMSH